MSTQLVVDANTVALWNFDQGLADSSPNALNLTNGAGTPTYVADPYDGSAVQGNGTWYGTNSSSLLNFGVGSFTVEVIFRFTATDASQTSMMSKFTGGTTTGWYLSRFANGIRFAAGDGGGGHLSDKSDATSLVGATYKHFASVIDRSGNTLKSYLNGSQVFTTTDITLFGTLDDSNGTEIGRITSVAVLLNLTELAEVRISNIARSPATFPTVILGTEHKTDIGYVGSAGAGVGGTFAPARTIRSSFNRLRKKFQ